MRCRHFLTGTALVSTLAVLAAAPTAANAQQANAQPADSGSTLEEVVVTAQRREESLQKVPVAVSAVSSEQIQKLGIVDTATLSNFVPGLNITRGNVAAVPFLRGVGNFTASPGNEAANALYVDDVYYASPAGSTFSFNNIARIEVLKGPQGTLFGRNATGGVIQIVTKDPTHDAHADIKAGVANYDTYSGSFYGTTGLSDNLAADLAMNVEKQSKGWGHNLFDGDEVYLHNSFSVRSKWIWTPTDSTRVRFIADYDRTRNDQGSAQAIAPGTISIGGYQHVGGFYDINTNADTFGRLRQYGASVRIDQELGWARATSISSYRNSRAHFYNENDASPLILQESDSEPYNKTWTQEFQLSSPSGSSLEWVAGVFGFFDDAGQDPARNIGNIANRPQRTQILYDSQRTDSYAAYGQATKPFLDDKAHLTLGVRYTLDKRKITGQFFDINGVQFNSANQSDKWGKFTYRIALDYNFSDDMLGYASYSTGFKSGNFNTLGPTAAPVKPMVLDAYEVGVKSEFAQHTVRLNVSAFYYKFHDVQVQQLTAANPIQINAAEAEYKGVDVDLVWAPTHNLTIQAAGELLDANYTSFPGAVFAFPCTSIALAGCATSIGGGGYRTAGADAAGNQIPFSEDSTGTLSATYRIPMTAGEWAITGSAAYHDGFPFDVQGLAKQSAYTLINASIDWTAASKAWDARIWVQNLTKQEVYGQRQVSSVGSTYTAGAPRTFGVTLGYHF
jgi:iron complex outermembrane receptor protein